MIIRAIIQAHEARQQSAARIVNYLHEIGVPSVVRMSSTRPPNERDRIEKQLEALTRARRGEHTLFFEDDASIDSGGFPHYAQAAIRLAEVPVTFCITNVLATPAWRPTDRVGRFVPTITTELRSTVGIFIPSGDMPGLLRQADKLATTGGLLSWLQARPAAVGGVLAAVPNPVQHHISSGEPLSLLNPTRPKSFHPMSQSFGTRVLRFELPTSGRKVAALRA